jgi:hypothetical protein
MNHKPNETMTHTHTPGPWTKSGCTVYAGQMAIAATYCEGNRFLHGVDHDETVPDSMETHGQGWDEAGANARLISSAPDLLEALLNLENNDGSIPSHAWKIVQAAIAKATGKGEE